MKDITRCSLLAHQDVVSRETKQVAASSLGIAALVLTAVGLFAWSLYTALESSGSLTLGSMGGESFIVGSATAAVAVYLRRRR